MCGILYGLGGDQDREWRSEGRDMSCGSKIGC